MTGGKAKDLGTLGGSSSEARALNQNGDVTGWALTADGRAHAFVYSKGRMIDVDNRTDEGDSSIGLAINAKREVVGQFRSASGFRAFLATTSSFKDLGVLAAGTVSSAWGINDRGTVVGESDLENSPVSPFRPFLYRNGVMNDLGHLDTDDRNASAAAINNAGQVAGWAEGSGGAMHLFMYHKGVMRDLGTFNTLRMTPTGINARGMIVGTAEIGEDDDGSSGFLYMNGKLVSLNQLIGQKSGWHIRSADGLNDKGQIVGYACKDAECRGVRLDPVKPLPKMETEQDADESGSPDIDE